MDLKKLNPWNWFKHEEASPGAQTIPVQHRDYTHNGQPMNNMMQLHHEIDRIFDNALRGFPALGNSGAWNQFINDNMLTAFHANVDIASDDNRYTITLEAPGMEQKDLSVELKDHTLYIKGDKQQENEQKDKHFYRVERHYGSFERVLAVPEDAETDNIQAAMKNGVLTVNIPRKSTPAADVKRINISH